LGGFTAGGIAAGGSYWQARFTWPPKGSRPVLRSGALQQRQLFAVRRGHLASALTSASLGAFSIPSPIGLEMLDFEKIPIAREKGSRRSTFLFTFAGREVATKWRVGDAACPVGVDTSRSPRCESDERRSELGRLRRHRIGRLGNAPTQPNLVEIGLSSDPDARIGLDMPIRQMTTSAAAIVVMRCSAVRKMLSGILFRAAATARRNERPLSCQSDQWGSIVATFIASSLSIAGNAAEAGLTPSSS